MKKLFVLIGFFVFIVGCSADVTENPTIPQTNSSVKSKVMSKESNTAGVTFEKVYPHAVEFMDMKRKEFGIKASPNLKWGTSKVVDITKIPGIVVPTLSDIEKLSPRRGKYFSGHNYKQIDDSSPVIGNGPSMTQNDEITLDYWSWSIPYPSPEKPFFEYMGSGQSSSIDMELMQIWSLHYDHVNSEYHYIYADDTYCQSLDASDWHERPEIPSFEVVGAHYFERLMEYPLLQFLDYSYAEDGAE